VSRFVSRLLPPFALEASHHDRLSERRDDAAFLDRVWSDPATRVLLVSGHRIGVDAAGGRPFTVGVDQAPAGLRLFLGVADSVAYVAVTEAEPGVVADLVTGAGMAWDSLRALLGVGASVEASVAVQAVALAEWHHQHPHCSVCGAETESVQAGSSRRCPSCGARHFPRTDPAVIMLVEDDSGRCLLGHNAARDATWYSTLAGFVEPGETLEDAVAREVHEETGVRVDDVAYRGSQPWPFPSSLMVGFHAHAASTDIDVDGVEITNARWFSRADVTREVEAGTLVIPSTISISGALLEQWFGGPLPAAPA
jgi:NAD+ diphosphatase